MQRRNSDIITLRVRDHTDLDTTPQPGCECSTVASRRIPLAHASRDTLPTASTFSPVDAVFDIRKVTPIVRDAQNCCAKMGIMKPTIYGKLHLKMSSVQMPPLKIPVCVSAVTRSNGALGHCLHATTYTQYGSGIGAMPLQ
jgi:hypothetical protein